MKAVFKSSVVGAVIVFSGSAFAEVPSLESAIEALPQDQFTEFEAQFDTAESVIDVNAEFQIDQAVVNQALEGGLITASQAEDLETTLTVIDENQEFFNFDVGQFITTMIANNAGLDSADVAATLEAFNSLSDAGKAIVGDVSFTPWDSGYTCASPCDPVTALANAANTSDAFDSLSAADQAIVAAAPLTDPDNL